MSEQATATASAPAAAPQGQTAQASAPAQAAQPSGKGAASNATAPAAEGKAGAAVANSEQTAENSVLSNPSWDPDTTKWLQSKGHDISAFDPANDSHKRLIKSIRDSEAEQTKLAQQRKTQELLEKSRKVVEKAQPVPEQSKELSPLEKFEQDYANQIQMALRYNGVKTAEELYAKNPDLYRELEAAYVPGKQDAWIAEQQWQKEQSGKAEAVSKQEAEFRAQFEAARSTVEKTMGDIRSKNPNFDFQLQTTGTMDVLKAIEETHSLPLELLFLNPKIAGFFADAVEALAYKSDEPARLEKWKQEYELSKSPMAAASAPVPAGAEHSAIPRAFVASKSYGDILDAAKIKR